MTVDCIFELQKAVYSALDGDGVLSALVTGVYSHVPQGTAFPYVKFGDARARDWSTKTTTGIAVSMVLDVFSRNRGAKESLEIAVEIKRILENVAFTMDNCTMVGIDYTGTDVVQSGDGLTWRGSVSFNVLVQQG